MHDRRFILRPMAMLLVGLCGPVLGLAEDGLIRNNKLGDVYYWFSSGLVGWNSSATLYAIASNLADPWTHLRPLRTDPASLDSYNNQHDFNFLPLVWEGGEPLLRWH